MTAKITHLVPALLAGLALSACHNLADHPGAHVEVVHQGELESRDIRDVVIAPVINESTTQEVPVDALRTGVSKALVKRRYSPLALSYVDDRAREASAGASLLGEDATLQLVIKEWDRSLWDSQGVLVVEVEAWMLDADYAGRELWGSRLERRYSLRQEMDVAATEAILMRKVCDQIADDLLEIMPAHTAKP
jgi:hypothetical protein